MSVYFSVLCPYAKTRAPKINNNIIKETSKRAVYVGEIVASPLDTLQCAKVNDSSALLLSANYRHRLAKLSRLLVAVPIGLATHMNS